MEEIIASYLFQKKNCPLPGVGMLHINNRTALYLQSEKQLNPPLPYISFNSAEFSSTEFIDYTAKNLSVSKNEAQSVINTFCLKLNNLDSFSEVEIPLAGKFYVDAEGSLVFKQFHFPESFLSAVHAERIVHPEATHSILVGDTESNSAIMTEYYSEPEPVKTSRWWIPLLILTLLALLIIAVYFINNYNNGTMGNATKLKSSTEEKTYKIPE
ncbi:MAG: hypothetical protein WKF35_08875 [Ferruginibacter sp.]